MAGVAHRQFPSPAWTPCKYQHCPKPCRHGFTFVQGYSLLKLGCSGHAWWHKYFSWKYGGKGFFLSGCPLYCQQRGPGQAGPTLSSQSQWAGNPSPCLHLSLDIVRKAAGGGVNIPTPREPTPTWQGLQKRGLDLLRSEIDNFPGKSKIPLTRVVGILATRPQRSARRGWKPFCKNGRRPSGRCPNDPYSQSTFISSLQVEVRMPSCVVCLFAQGREACVLRMAEAGRHLLLRAAKSSSGFS